MKDKFKNLISKYKGLNSEKKSSYFYGVIFLIILVLAIILKLTGGLETNKTINNSDNNLSEERDTKTKKTDYDNVFNGITNNYEEDILIYLYDTISYIDLKDITKKPFINISEKEFINVKRYQDKKILTYINLKEEKIEEEMPEYIDITFISPENILKLISSHTYKKDNRFMIETDAWIKLYSELTNKNIDKSVTGEIEVAIFSYDKNELRLSLDLTNLYKNIGYSYARVIYDITFYNVDNVYFEDTEIE